MSEQHLQRIDEDLRRLLSVPSAMLLDDEPVHQVCNVCWPDAGADAVALCGTPRPAPSPPPAGRPECAVCRDEDLQDAHVLQHLRGEL